MNAKDNLSEYSNIGVEHPENESQADFNKNLFKEIKPIRRIETLEDDKTENSELEFSHV